MSREYVPKPPRDPSKMSTDEIRREYARIRARSQARSNAEFDAAVRVKLKAGATPAHWLLAARRVRFVCRRCAGTGQFITHVLNGQPRGPGGPCYRCEGKGWQTDADARRNYGADIHQRVY